MSTVEARLKELGLVLPQPLQMPPGVTLPFPWVRVIGSRALISGHGPTNVDGSLAQPLGKVGGETLRVQYAEEQAISESVNELENVWRSSLGKKLEAEVMAAGRE